MYSSVGLPSGTPRMCICYCPAGPTTMPGHQLPLISPASEPGTTERTPTAPPTGLIAPLLAGHGLPHSSLANPSSLPPKLIKRIVSGKFIDMRELLPESWRTETNAASSTHKQASWGPVRDFRLWAECYAMLY